MLIQRSSFPVDVQGRDALTFSELYPLFRLSGHFKINSLTTSVTATIMALEQQDADVVQCLALSLQNPEIFPIGYRDKLFRRLCERQDCLSDDEAELLGARMTASIARWRLKLNSRAIPEGSAFMPREDDWVCIDKSPKLEEVRDDSNTVGFWRLRAV